MKFQVGDTFSRAVTVTLESDGRYFSGEKVRIYLNGEFVKETEKNVFSLFSLEPDTEYRLTAVDEGGREESASFRTGNESAYIDVTEIGARGDGYTDDTEAIQAAICLCPPDGTVYVPAGDYCVRPLFLKSRMTFYLDEGARLLAGTDRRAYPILPGVIRKTGDWDEEYCFGSWEGNPLDQYVSLITAIGAESLDIVGEGILDGNAENGDWWKFPKKKMGAWRPNTVFFSSCKNVRMCGIHVKNSPCWTIHPLYSEGLRFLDLDIENPPDSPNTDGLDPESCRDVFISGTRISVGDDCVAIKSGKLYMARAHFFRMENVRIENCFFERGHGGVTIGSEAACGVSDVLVTKSIFKETDRGLRIKTRRGRGEKSLLTGICFENLLMDAVRMPFTANMFYFCDPDGHTPYVQEQNACPVDEMTPKIGSIRISGIEIRNADVVLACMYGLPEQPIESVVIEDVSADFCPQDIRKKELPIMMDDFPEMSGASLYMNNIKSLNVRNVSITGEELKEPEIRHVAKKDIEGLTINGRPEGDEADSQPD